MRPRVLSQVAALAVGALSLAPVTAWAGGSVVIRVNPGPRQFNAGFLPPGSSVIVVPPGSRVVVVPPSHRRHFILLPLPYYPAAPAYASSYFYMPAYASSSIPGYAQGHGILIIEAEPADAQVFLDGQPVGTAGQFAAQAVDLAPGRHLLAITAPGFKPFSAEFVASPDYPTRIRVPLAPE